MSITELRGRAAARAAAPLGSGIAIGGSAFGGSPWYVTVFITVCGVIVSVVPQESQHRRDVWRDWLSYRERHYLIRKGHKELLSASGPGRGKRSAAGLTALPTDRSPRTGARNAGP